LCVVFAGRKQPKEVGKMREIDRKFNFKLIAMFKKNPAKCTKFEVSVSNFKVSSLGIFDEVSVSKF